MLTADVFINKYIAGKKWAFKNRLWLLLMMKRAVRMREVWKNEQQISLTSKPNFPERRLCAQTRGDMSHIQTRTICIFEY